MLKISINFNDFVDKKELYTFLSKSLDFPEYFSYNLDSLYDILLDIDLPVKLIINNKQKFEDIYLTLKDAEKENDNIIINEEA